MSHNTAVLVAEYTASGLTQKAFCARKGIAVSALQYHLEKIRKREEGGEEDRAPASAGRFIPLRLSESGRMPTTVVMFRGHVGCGELAELVRAMAE
jgi:hypothetical protein